MEAAEARLLEVRQRHPSAWIRRRGVP